MTVVAAYTLHGYIYLFGDLLLSDSQDAKGSIELPISGNNPNLKPNRSRFSELRQKIVVISPYLALGFAGDFENAQKLFVILKSKAESLVRLDYSEVYAQIETASRAAELEGHEIAIVGWYCFENGTCKTLGVNTTSHEHAGGGHILVAGTGSAVFLDAFDWTVRHSISNTSLLPGLDPKIHWLVLQASLVGNEGFLRDEAGTLAQLIGGGYELVAQSAKGFYKVDDVTVVLWDALCSFEGRPKYRYAPFLAYKMSYKGDALVVRVRSLGGKSYGGVDFPARDAPFFALPPYSDSPDPLPDEIKSVQLESQAVCHMVFVSRDDAFLGFFLNIDFGSGRGHCEDVVFSYTKQGERISFGCEISENRKQAFRDGILDMTVIKPALSSPT